MRFFAYEGADAQGRPVQGTIQAATGPDAQRLLQGGGMRNVKVRELSAVGVPAAAPASSRPVSPPVVQTPMAGASPRPAPAPAPVVSAVAPTVRYRKAGNKTSFFLFEALGRYIRSGIAANRALEELGQRARQPWLGERLSAASAAVAKGASLADALEACHCFPTGVVGTIRAGEASGAVPDACAQVALGCEQAHKLGSRCAWMTIMFVFFALWLPIGLSFVHGSVAAMEAQADANGTLPAGATAAAKIGGQLRHNLPWALPWWIAVIGGWRLWLTHQVERTRHRAVLVVPILSGRAREESLARIAWALTELSRAGVPPHRALRIAADAAPNLLIADRFREQADRMREQDRLSAAMRATGYLAPQLVDVVENGELAGDVPGAVASVHRATSAEFEQKNATAHTRIWFVLYPILGVLVAVVLANLYKILFTGEIHAMLKDT